MFLITWTGGYELPDYFATNDRDEAMQKFADWCNELEPEDGEIVQALLVQDGTVEILESFTAEDKEGSIY